MNGMGKADIAQQNGIDQDTWVALKYSIYPGCRDESIVRAYQYCQSRNLDVMKKPVHIVSTKLPERHPDGSYVYNQKGGRVESYQDVLLPGITEYRITACKTGLFAGHDEPQFGPMVTMHGRQVPEWCKVTVYRFVNGQKCAFTHIEFFEEACGLKDSQTNNPKLNAVWARRPRGQLAKCAEAGALRKAFPGEIGGLVTAEEMTADADMSAETVAAGNAPLTKTGEHRHCNLSDEQLMTLENAIAEAGTLNPQTILKAYQVARFEEIPAEKFEAVMKRIADWVKHRDLVHQAQNPECHSSQQDDQEDVKKTHSSGHNVPPVYVRDDAPALGESSGKTANRHQNTSSQEIGNVDDDEIIYQ